MDACEQFQKTNAVEIVLIVGLQSFGLTQIFLQEEVEDRTEADGLPELPVIDVSEGDASLARELFVVRLQAIIIVSERKERRLTIVRVYRREIVTTAVGTRDGSIVVDWKGRQCHRCDRLWQEGARRVRPVGIRRSIPTGRGPGSN